MTVDLPTTRRYRTVRAVANEQFPPPRLRLTRGRAVATSCVASLSVVLVAALLSAVRSHLAPGVPPLVLLLCAVLAGLLGGRGAAIVTGLVATVAYNVGFIPPVGTLRIHFASDAIVLGVFLSVAMVVGTLVASVEARRVVAARRADELEHAQVDLRRALTEARRLRTEAERVELLEQIDRQRRALLRSVSHDLRTPLASILGVATELTTNGADYAEATRQRLLELVVIEAQRLDAIVGNLLSLSRVEAGALLPSLQPVSLADAAQRAAARVASRPGMPRFIVDVAASLPPANADPVQLDQVLTNLLENAGRYTPAGGAVEVGVIREGQVLHVTVADRGPGIAAARRDTLFAPFSSDEPGRSGLGLAICKAIVEAHGGTIRISDRPGSGTLVDFSLSVAQ